MTWSTLLLLAGVGQTVLAAQDTFQSQCQNFPSKIHLRDVTVNFAQYIPAGTNLSLADAPPSCGEAYQAVSADVCRVAMAVATSNSSEITLEAWFPRDYNGRFLSTGNGGLSGCIQYYDIAYTSGMGFATVGANNGHNGTSGEPFFHHPEVIEDFAYRSVHTGVVVGKELTKLFYAQGFNKSYYLGCSTGGRQGFKSIQQFPEDFDGVVAGAPAFSFIGLLSWSARFYTITGNANSSTFLTSAQWTAVHNEILRQCDDLDGAKDGILEDPDLCHPIIETLICQPGSNHTTCLTGQQAETVRQVLSPLYDENGQLLYPRMQPGAEESDASIFYAGTDFPYSTDWFRYVVYNDTTWDPATFSVKDAAAALAQNPFNIQTWDGDLSRFRATGGKVLTYHGLEDQLISSENSKRYYGHVASTMNLAPSQLDEFYRFFTISGMSHCSGGSGAHLIGNQQDNEADTDPQDNVLTALVRWVEEGIAPETIRGTSATSPKYYRRHCRYPKRNAYVGPGPYTDETAWRCV
ncbi:putative feruloyl esterase B-2 [Paecilomyces lecythidis]|uniref:Carboxylic ester hydrolase n=1 Tax=Paecilomyces lecythidis TaxID=3004212 RepID=A0ABR3X3L5_9EURO